VRPYKRKSLAHALLNPVAQALGAFGGIRANLAGALKHLPSLVSYGGANCAGALQGLFGLLVAFAQPGWALLAR